MNLQISFDVFNSSFSLWWGTKRKRITIVRERSGDGLSSFMWGRKSLFFFFGIISFVFIGGVRVEKNYPCFLSCSDKHSFFTGKKEERERPILVFSKSPLYFLMFSGRDDVQKRLRPGNPEDFHEARSGWRTDSPAASPKRVTQLWVILKKISSYILIFFFYISKRIWCCNFFSFFKKFNSFSLFIIWCRI